MARASTTTWLSLDDWAKIFGINPLHFNGIYTSFLPVNPSCDDLWWQHSWQGDNQISREDIATAISDAEQQIANYVGYNLMPDWIRNEHINTTPHYNRALPSPMYNARFAPKTIQTMRGYLLTAGTKAKQLINPQASITRVDKDGDGYAEHCTVIVTTSVTNLNEIKIYFPDDFAGLDEWEIRPVSLDRLPNSKVQIDFKIWQVVKPYLWESLSATPINGDIADNFLTYISVYRVFTDNNNQATMLWNSPNDDCSCCLSTCGSCQYRIECACLQIKDVRLGHFQYERTTSNNSGCVRDADRIITNYYSGWKWDRSTRPCVELDPYWQRAIAYYSVALIPREICGCCVHEAKFKHWQQDFTESAKGEVSSFIGTVKMRENPFGSKRGGWYAWERANQENRRISK